MATMQECETIELIKSKKQKAREGNEDVSYALCGGKDYFRKAIQSVSNSGQFTLIVSLCLLAIGIVVKALQYISLSEYYTINYGYMIGEFVGIIIVTAIPAIIGAKIMKLDSTPNFMLGLLIVTLIFNIFFTVGVLPLVALIMNIVALTRWSTYRSWFYSIKKK